MQTQQTLFEKYIGNMLNYDMSSQKSQIKIVLKLSFPVIAVNFILILGALGV